LRTTGTVGNRGRVNPIGDPALVRVRRQRQQAEALAAHERLRESVLTDGSVPLSVFGELPAATFAELLALLAVGLDAPLASDGSRRGLSADGAVEVVLRDPGNGRTACLRTDAGTLRAPDYDVSIVLTDAAVPREEAAGG
jgi:hypothetical protein